MPECQNCGETHATVNEAEWVNQSVTLCPSCWDYISKLVERGNP